MAAAYGRRQQELRRCVTLCRLLLVVVLVVIIGDAVVDARAASSPRTDDEVALQTETEQLQGFSRRSGEAPTTTTAAGGCPAPLNKEQQTAGGGRPKRMLVGSRAPICTYNECRGCRHRCSVQEVPIDASDPINSAYHYKCICHL